jgi:hypothetical protein
VTRENVLISDVMVGDGIMKIIMALYGVGMKTMTVMSQPREYRMATCNLQSAIYLQHQKISLVCFIALHFLAFSCISSTVFDPTRQKTQNTRHGRNIQTSNQHHKGRELKSGQFPPSNRDSGSSPSLPP